MSDTPQPRRCLRCLKTFASNGPGNRICKPCSSEASRHYRESPKIIERTIRMAGNKITDDNRGSLL